jgi:hypothetical protein
MSRFREGLLNCVTIILLIAVVVPILKQYLFSKNEGLSGPPIGFPVSIPNIDWATNRRTLIVALQEDCQFCNASVPFYHDLLASQREENFYIMAVTRGPNEIDGFQTYLKRQQLDFRDVQAIDFDKTRITATPMLILVNAEGLVAASWTGKLSEKEEAEVFKALGTERIRDKGAKRNNSGEGSGTFKKMDFAKFTHSAFSGMPIIDIRKREQFKLGHISGAINIPYDELEVRARFEITPTHPVLIYCNDSKECSGSPNSKTGSNPCNNSVSLLHEYGITDIVMLNESLTKAAKSGVIVEGTL